MSHQSLLESNDKLPSQPLNFNNNNNKEEITLKKVLEEESVVEDEDSGRERLKRHRIEVGGRVWIPEIWGQEEFLVDWIDCNTAFHAHFVHSRITTAREALVEEGRKVNASGISIENRC